MPRYIAWFGGVDCRTTWNQNKILEWNQPHKRCNQDLIKIKLLVGWQDNNIVPTYLPTLPYLWRGL